MGIYLPLPYVLEKNLFIKVELIYNTVLVSGVWQSDFYIYIYIFFFRFFPTVVYLLHDR